MNIHFPYILLLKPIPCLYYLLLFWIFCGIPLPSCTGSSSLRNSSSASRCASLKSPMNLPIDLARLGKLACFEEEEHYCTANIITISCVPIIDLNIFLPSNIHLIAHSRYLLKLSNLWLYIRTFMTGNACIICFVPYSLEIFCILCICCIL